MTRTLGEIFAHARTITKNPEKAEYLKKHWSPALGYLLKLAFNDVKWLLPEGAPPYKAEKAGPGLTDSHLLRELRRVYIFLEGGNNNLAQIRRELLFRDLLQILDKEEVELLIAVKDKTFSKDFKISKSFIEKTFPGLLEAPLNIRFIKN